MICELRTLRSRPRFAAALLLLAVFALMPSQSASAAFIQLSAQTPTVMPGQTDVITVTFYNYDFTAGPSDPSPAFNLYGGGLAISYDKTRFTVSNVVAGNLNGLAEGFLFVPNATTSGEVTSSFASSGTPIAAGQVGTLETFTLTALSTPGAGAINLQQSFSATNTELDNDTGVVTLSPAPGDARLNTSVTVIGPVPEPSSLVLMGLGGGLITLATRFRKKMRKASRSR
jgi:hypothetical protein